MRLCLISILFILSQWALSAETIKSDHLKISWLSPNSFNSINSEYIGIYYQIDPDWHVYWRNPGDSGAAPKFDFVEKNVDIGPALWPAPRRLPIGDLVNLGYETATAIFFKLSPHQNQTHVNVKVKLEWLVCKESCIPGFGELTLVRPIQPGDSVWNPKDLEIRNEIFKSVPPVELSSKPWKVSDWKLTTGQLELKLVSENNIEKDPPSVFPFDGEYITPKAPVVKELEKSQKKYELSYVFNLAPGATLPKELSFLVAAGDGRSWEYTIGPQKVKKNSDDNFGLMTLLFLAFLGGIILNLMPCVLPVLSIKFLSILKTTESRRHRDALLYLAGVLSTFFTLGAVFLILRAAGSSIGWGFQLQSPYVVLVLISLFWLMSLNFLGFFEFGDSITNLAGRSTSGGSFTTGVLAVFVAAPCTGPFMGTALGAAAVLPAVQALGIFLSLGLGLSFPFVLVSFVPALYRLMPKPGAWTERLKQFLAFPLLATVIWLMWVVGIQLGTDGWVVSSSLLLLISFALWVWTVRSRAVRWAGVAFTIFGIVFALNFMVQQMKIPASAKVNSPSTSDWVKYDRAVLNQALSEGKSVFVDFTAAWCITCQVNKKAVLEKSYVLETFKTNSVVLMRADWTKQDPIITKALAEFDRNSVPVYLFYKNGAAKPEILPQILTTETINKLFN